MCDTAILQNGGMLKSVPNSYKNKKINKAIDNYTYALEFVPDCCKTQNNVYQSCQYFSCNTICSECYKTQEMCAKGYLHYKMIASQNVSSEAQVKNFFIL